MAAPIIHSFPTIGFFSDVPLQDVTSLFIRYKLRVGRMMQAKRHTLRSMASPAYNAQTAISISWQYFIAPLSFHMIAPKASFHVKVDAVNVFLQSPTIYTAKGPKNSHANSKHLIMVSKS